MKTLVFVLFLSLFSKANEAKPLLVDRSISLQNYNHKASVKLQHQHKLKRLARITSSKAKEITVKVCNKPVVNQKLTHKGQLLFYLNKTKVCMVKVNALDGTIISKVIEK